MNCINDHHPWCNYWMAGKVEDCRHCKRLFELYPICNRTPRQMTEDYFPDAIIVGDDHEDSI